MSERSIKLSNDPGLKRRLGVPAIVFAVVAWAAPLLVVQGLMPSMVVYARQSLVLAFFLMTLILLFFGTGYANITKHVDNPGAYYAYVTAGLGRSAGLGGAFIAIFAYAMLMLSTWVSFGTFFRTLVMMFGGPDIAWFVYSLFGALLSGIVAYIRVDFSTSVMMVLLACEAILVAMFIIAVIIKGGPDGGMSITPLTPSGWSSGGSLALGMLYAMLGFIGFESATIYREEAKDPVKTVTISIYTAIIAIGVFYMFAAWAMLTALGDSGVVSLGFDQVTTLFNDICNTYIGPWVPVLTNIFICTSSFACLLAQHNSLSRYLYSLGKDGIIPARFGIAHSKTGSPAFAVIIVTIASFIFIFISMCISGFTFAGEEAYDIYIKCNGFGTLTVIVLMLIVSIAILSFFVKRKRNGDDIGSVFKGIIAPVIALIGLLIMFVLVIMNLGSVTGFSYVASAIAAIIIIPAVFLWGFGLAERIRKRSPEKYQKIGRN